MLNMEGGVKTWRYGRSGAPATMYRRNCSRDNMAIPDRTAFPHAATPARSGPSSRSPRLRAVRPGDAFRFQLSEFRLFKRRGSALDPSPFPLSGAPAQLDLAPDPPYARPVTAMPKILIRNETQDDVCAITEVTIAAFKTLEISHHTEQFIIQALRAAKALTLSLVAEMDRRVIGHIAFSPVTISDGTPNWYGLGPVSVLPEHQRKGIGKALIVVGLSRLKDMNAQGCCLVGHPDYYKKFGFKNLSGLVLEGVPPEVFFALSFDGHTPQDSVAFHEGFKADGQQDGAGDALQRA